MRVTKHRNESSLRSYNTDNTEAQKKNISNILSGPSTSSDTQDLESGEGSSTHYDVVDVGKSNQSGNQSQSAIQVPDERNYMANTQSIHVSGNQNCVFNFYLTK